MPIGSTSSVAPWVSVLAALLTPVIAVLAVYIAWQQWRTNRNKLKLDLFDRRYAFYEAARELIGAVMTSGQATDKTTFRFLRKTRGARFIVGIEIAAYLDKELYAKAVDLNCLQAELEGVGVGDIRTANVRKQSEIKKWFRDQYEVLDRRFESQLNLEH